MKPEEKIEEELNYRILQESKFYNNQMPERVAIAWRSYLAGLLEWDIISIGFYDQIISLIPPVKDDPSVDILKGRNDYS